MQAAGPDQETAVLAADACPPCDPTPRGITSHPRAPRRDRWARSACPAPRTGWVSPSQTIAGGGPSAGASDTVGINGAVPPGTQGGAWPRTRRNNSPLPGQRAARSQDSWFPPRWLSRPGSAGAFCGLRRPPAGLSGSTGTTNGRRPPPSTSAHKRGKRNQSPITPPSQQGSAPHRPALRRQPTSASAPSSQPFS